MKLILGSSSKYRKQILEGHGYQCEVLVPGIEESAISTPDFYERPVILARAKARAIQNKVTESALIITADIIVVCDGEMYEKPQSLMEAKKFLKKYSDGYAAETICAFVVINTLTGKKVEGTDRAKVFFHPLPDEGVEDFLKYGEPLSRAGGFAIQHPLLKPYINKLEGTVESIVGMPVHLLEKLLQEVKS